MIYKTLREIRNKKGITAKQMAEALGLKTKAAYYKKETGNNKFSVEEAKIVADILEEKIEDIFFANEVSCEDTKIKAG